MSTYPLIRLGDDAYIAWVGSCDAPGSPVMTYAEAYEAYGPAAVERARRNGHSYSDLPPTDDPLELVRSNRAGPRESNLTVEALIARYSPGADRDAPLQPSEIAPYLTSYAVGPDDPEYGKSYWVPWPPDEVPERITPATDLGAVEVEATPESIEAYGGSRRYVPPFSPAQVPAGMVELSLTRTWPDPTDVPSRTMVVEPAFVEIGQRVDAVLGPVLDVRVAAGDRDGWERSSLVLFTMTCAAVVPTEKLSPAGDLTVHGLVDELRWVDGFALVAGELPLAPGPSTDWVPGTYRLSLRTP